MKKKFNIVAIALLINLTSYLGYAQEVQIRKDHPDYLSMEERIELIAEIIQDNYYDSNSGLRKTDKFEREKHRNLIYDQYRKQGLDAIYWVCYFAHIHPSKLKTLKDFGVVLDGLHTSPSLESQLTKLKYYTATYEIIIIGRVYKKIYLADSKDGYHTKIIIQVNEYLRDDYNLSHNVDEVAIKIRSGPVKNGWLNSLHEPTFDIGEEVLLFLSRARYIRSVIGSGDKYDYLKENPYVFFTRIKLNISGDKIYWNNSRYSTDLNEFVNTVKEIVQILDVQNFYNF